MLHSRIPHLAFALLPFALAGCGGSAAEPPAEPGSPAATTRYAPRADLLVIAIPEGAPTHWNAAGFPPTRSARLVGGVQVEGVDAGGNLVVHSVFQMTEWRKRQPRQLAGRYTHKLAAEGDGWRIRMKRVDLVNCDDAHDAFEVFV